MALDQLTPLDPSATMRAKINAAIVQANSLTDLVTRLQALEYQLVDSSRPGDSTAAFTGDVSIGNPLATALLNPALAVVSATGSVVRVGESYVAMRRVRAIEAGQAYRARYVVTRNTDSGDPAGDAVQFAVACYDNTKAYLGSIVLQTMTALNVAAGRIDYQALVSTTPGGDIAGVLLAGTCYARSYVRAYGTTQLLDVEILDLQSGRGLTTLDAVVVATAAAQARADRLQADQDVVQSNQSQLYTAGAAAATNQAMLTTTSIYALIAGNPQLVYAQATWAGLSSLVPTTGIGSGGQVMSADSGVHFDPTLSSTSIVTVSIASPAVVNWAAHGLTAGAPVKLSTTGTLPTGILAGTTYYVLPVDANTFQVSATVGGSPIGTTGSQSGTHTGVANGTSVPNAGTYTYMASGWRRISSAAPSALVGNIYSTRAAALAAKLTIPANVVIQADESNGNYPSFSYFDGWDLRLIQVLPWLPSMLYANGERAVFYNFTDASSLYQDRAGTVPVVNDGDRIAVALDRRVPRTNPTTVPRRNLLAGSEDLGAGVNPVGVSNFTLDASYLTAANGAATYHILEDSSNGSHFIAQPKTITVSNAQTVTVSGTLRAAERTQGGLVFDTSGHYALWDLTTGVVLAKGAGVTAIAAVADGTGAWVCQASMSANGTAGQFAPGFLLGNGGSVSYAGSPTSGVYASGLQLEIGASATPYQKVGSDNLGWIGGNPLSTAMDAQRPTWRNTGGKKFATWDGVANCMFADGVDLRSSSVTTFILALDVLAETNGTVALHGLTSFFQGVGGLEVDTSNTNVGAIGAGFGSDQTHYLFETSADSVQLPRTAIVIVEFNPLAATPAQQILFTINGTTWNQEQIATAGVLSLTAIYRIKTLMLGGRSTAKGGFANTFGNFNLYAFLAVARQLTPAEKAMATTWFGLAAGIVFPPAAFAYSDVPSIWADTAPPTLDANGIYRTSCYARRSYPAYTGNWLQLQTWSDAAFAPSPPPNASLYSVSVWVNGAFYTEVRPGAAGLCTNIVPLPSGTKKVEVVNSAQTRPGSTPIGVFIKMVSGDAPLAYAVPIAPAKRVVVVADSIGVGAIATRYAKYAWVMQLRAAATVASTPASVAVDGFGYKALWDDAQSSATINAAVARLVTLNPTHIVIQAMTNDYGLAKWAAAAYQTGLASYLDAVHAALPSAQVIIKTAGPRAVETANSFGNTLGDYRTAASNAQSSRSAWCALIDGTVNGYTAADYASGVGGDGTLHPGNQGQANEYLFWKGYFGF